MKWMQLCNEVDRFVLIDDDTVALCGVSAHLHGGLWCAYAYPPLDDTFQEKYFLDVEKAKRYCEAQLNTPKV